LSLTSGEEGVGEFTRSIRAVWIWFVSGLFKAQECAGPCMTIPLVNRKLVVVASEAPKSSLQRAWRSSTYNYYVRDEQMDVKFSNFYQFAI
jgi:hypothetical protein